MLNLLKDFFDTANGFHFLMVELISIISLLFGISVINSKNPVISVLFLIGLFISVSVNLIFIGFSFIGLSYLLVYVGAISILFLFILMLINIRISELLNDTNNGIPLAIYTGFSFCFPIYLTIISNDNLKQESTDTNNTLINFSYYFSKYLKKIIISDNSINWDPYDQDITNWDLSDQDLIELSDSHELTNSININSKLHYVSSNTWDNNLTNTLDITSIGNVLYSTFAIWLIICSVILLLAMIGAITITKKEKN